MRDVGGAFQEILEGGDYTVETRVQINGTYYNEDVIWSMSSKRGLFKEDKPMVGCAVAGEIELTMDYPGTDFPKMAQIRPFIRLKQDKTNYLYYSEWIQKGEFFIDQRKYNEDSDTLYIHGFDAIRKTQADYPSSTYTWNSEGPNAYQVVLEIANHIGVTIDYRTIDKLYTQDYVVGFPAQYSMHEVLESIAAMYGGNFCISDEGMLMLVGFKDFPVESYYLVTENGDYITFGGTRILLCS